MKQRRTKFHPLIPAALLLAAAMACSIPAGSPDDRLSLRLEPERETLAPGETVALRLFIRNPAPDSVRLRGASSCPPFGFRIVGSTDQPTMNPDTWQLCTSDVRTWTIAPGGELQHTFRWDGRVVRSDGSIGRLAAGEYHLEPVVGGEGFGWRAGPPARLVVVRE